MPRGLGRDMARCGCARFAAHGERTLRLQHGGLSQASEACPVCTRRDMPPCLWRCVQHLHDVGSARGTGQRTHSAPLLGSPAAARPFERSCLTGGDVGTRCGTEHRGSQQDHTARRHRGSPHSRYPMPRGDAYTPGTYVSHMSTIGVLVGEDPPSVDDARRDCQPCRV